METIHVAYAFDDNYAEMSCVSMASMLYNTRRSIHFHVIESGLSLDNKNIIDSLKERFPHGRWTFHNIRQFDKNQFFISDHFTVETYYRLLLPDLLPQLGRIIYIDGDTVVEGDITELWQIELQDELAGVTPAIRQSNFRRNKEILGMHESDMYFNAGVLLLNLTRLREFDLLNKALDVLPTLHKTFTENHIDWFVDQEILNHLFNKKCKYISPKFNFADHIMDSVDCDGICLADWREAFLSPVIVHHIARDKPSKISNRYMFSRSWERYYVYKAMTPYADTSVDSKRIERYHKHEQQIENALIFPYIYLEYKKHSLFSELAGWLADPPGGKKLALWGVNNYTRHLMAVLSTKDVYPNVVVDGLAQNRLRDVFHYEVQSPEILKDASGEFFVLLCMVNEKPAEQVGSVLADYGYSKDDYVHIFAPLWAVINKL